MEITKIKKDLIIFNRYKRTVHITNVKYSKYYKTSIVSFTLQDDTNPYINMAIDDFFTFIYSFQVQLPFKYIRVIKEKKIC